VKIVFSLFFPTPLPPFLFPFFIFLPTTNLPHYAQPLPITTTTLSSPPPPSPTAHPLVTTPEEHNLNPDFLLHENHCTSQLVAVLVSSNL
jgi:hypothetical protein